MACGVICASTPERLRAAGDAGILSHATPTRSSSRSSSCPSFASTIRWHSSSAGDRPDDFVDPSELSTLTRSYLKEAFRAVAAVQQGDLQRPRTR